MQGGEIPSWVAAKNKEPKMVSFTTMAPTVHYYDAAVANVSLNGLTISIFFSFRRT